MIPTGAVYITNGKETMAITVSISRKDEDMAFLWREKMGLIMKPKRY